MLSWQPGRTPDRGQSRFAAAGRIALLAAAALCLDPWQSVTTSAEAPPTPKTTLLEATTSFAARQDAIQAIPFDKLDAAAKAKANGVLNNLTVFRRLPVRVIDCDPDLYLFLVRHPDVVVNIWEVMKLTQIQVRQTATNSFKIVEPAGTQATMEYLYRGHDIHVMYAEGSYTGLARPVHGRCLVVLKSGYVRETNGRYYITNRLDAFLSVEPGAVELVTKAIHPLVGKIADNNFIQTAGFVSSLSRTAETNAPGVQRLASKLTYVQPEYRQQLTDLAAAVASKSAQTTQRSASRVPLVATRKEGDVKQ